MLRLADLGPTDAPVELLQVWRDQIENLTDIQERAIRAGVLTGSRNMLVVAPTSSGKTFIGEMAATVSAFRSRRHSIFIVPYRALAEEHFELFRERYGDLLAVVISSADYTEFDQDIISGNFNLAVMTYEKLMSLAARRRDLIDRCTTLVIDEVQSLSDSERGAKLEALLTGIKVARGTTQIVALSASLDDINQFDTWLDAQLVISNERPVPLKQMVCAVSGRAMTVDGDSAVEVQRLASPNRKTEELAISLARRYVDEGKQVIVFRSSIPGVERVADILKRSLPARGMSEEIGKSFALLEDSPSIRSLSSALASGVGFHTADLTHPERTLVEKAFRDGSARVVVATPTLLMGVNLPTDVVVFTDTSRWSRQGGRWVEHHIPVADYRNAAGRAGRLGQRTSGLAIVLAKNDPEMRQLVHAYLLGPVDPIESQIPKRPFNDVIFSIICSGVAKSRDDLVNFIASSFAFLTFYERYGGGLAEVETSIDQAIATCVSSGLVAHESGVLAATAVGRVLGSSGVGLEGAVRLTRLLDKLGTTGAPTAEVLFEIASCREAGDRPWAPSDGDQDIDPRPTYVPSPTGYGSTTSIGQVMAKVILTSAESGALVRTRCLLEWMSGATYQEIWNLLGSMGAAAERVRVLGRNAAWLLDALAQAAEKRGLSDRDVEQVRGLAAASRYGLPTSLAPLARLRAPGITRDVLMNLLRRAPSPELLNPTVLVDSEDSRYAGLLTPVQLNTLRTAVATEISESLSRKRAGQVARVQGTSLDQKLIDDLYALEGTDLERAVADALNDRGIAATWVKRQPKGEEDVRVTHSTGMIAVSVTASQDPAKRVKWTKAKEILGAGAGLNPVNYICIARPGFDALAEENAWSIAREVGQRSLLLIPLEVFAEAIVRIAESNYTAPAFNDVLASKKGVLSVADLA